MTSAPSGGGPPTRRALERAAPRPADRLADRVQHVPVDWIKPNPFQPRVGHGDDDEGSRADEALREDMRQNGFRGAVQVRRDPATPRGAYELVFGHRRLRVWRSLGHADIPCQVVEHTDKEMRLAAVTENLVRADLTPWEEALALQELRRDGMGYKALAARLGRSVGWVQNRLRLLQLEGEALQEAARTQPEMLTVLTLLALFDPQDQERLFAMVRAGAYNTEDLKALLVARRAKLRQQDAAVTDEGGTIHEVPLRQRAGSGRYVTAERPAPRARIDEGLLQVVERSRADRGSLTRAVAEAMTKPPIAEHPADHPEAAATGLTVDPGIERWEDLPEPTAADAVRATELAAGLPRPVLTSETHWVNPSPQKKGPAWENAEFVRITTGVVASLRRNIERTDPALMTDEQRQELRRCRQDVAEILGIF